MLGRPAASSSASQRSCSAPSEPWSRLYRSCSGYVCFSEREGLGWAILDALAFGKPVCSRRIGICRALHEFEATEDFSKPVFKAYEMPPTGGFEGLVASIPMALQAAQG